MVLPAPKPQSVSLVMRVAEVATLHDSLSTASAQAASQQKLVPSCGDKQDTRLPTPTARAQACSVAQQTPFLRLED